MFYEGVRKIVLAVAVQWDRFHKGDELLFDKTTNLDNAVPHLGLKKCNFDNETISLDTYLKDKQCSIWA